MVLLVTQVQVLCYIVTERSFNIIIIVTANIGIIIIVIILMVSTSQFSQKVN